MRMLTLRVMVPALLVLAMAVPTKAELDAPQIVLSPYAGSTFWDSDVALKDKLLYGGRAGIMLFPWIGFEGTYGFSRTETDGDPAFDTDMEKPDHLMGAAEDALKAAQKRGTNQMEFHR